MLPIRKNDTVTLSDADRGKVIDIIITDVVKVYKVEKFVSNEIIYVEEKLVRLTKQSPLNYTITLAREAFNFLMYTFKP